MTVPPGLQVVCMLIYIYKVLYVSFIRLRDLLPQTSDPCTDSDLLKHVNSQKAGVAKSVSVIGELIQCSTKNAQI